MRTDPKREERIAAKHQFGYEPRKVAPMREHAENAPLTFKIEGSTVPGHEGKHSVSFTRTFDSKSSQSNIESLTTEELVELHRAIELYVRSLIPPATESHPEWDACRRNASERA